MSNCNGRVYLERNLSEYVKKSVLQNLNREHSLKPKIRQFVEEDLVQY